MFFLLLLLGATPVFIWAVMTQRIELRKRAATSEPVVCWNRVGGTAPNLYWPNGCKGNPTPQMCTQATVPLTATEIYKYNEWVANGKPYIAGCGMVMPTPSTNPVSWNHPNVYMRTGDLSISSNNKVFRFLPDPGKPISTFVSSPGNAYTVAVGRSWYENGISVGLTLIFEAITTDLSYPPNGKEWEFNEAVFTYNASQSNQAQMRFSTDLDAKRIRGQYGYGWGTNALSLTSNSGSTYPTTITFINLELGAFLDLAGPTITTTPSPLTCGGIRGIVCPSGYTCRYPDGSTRPPYPDASGICRANNPYPTPTCIPRPACMDPLPGQPACMIKIPEGGWLCPKTPTPTAIPTCGGIAGRVCPSGYSCMYSNGTSRPSYPDESGKCILPQKEFSCVGLSSARSTYFTSCASQGFSGVCFNKYTGVYQGCTRTGSNDCTVNNMNAAQNILCPVAVTPTPTCIPRPACMDPLPGQPACMLDLPPGGWLCPKSPTPSEVCKTGVSSFAVGQPCKDPNTFVSATYTCQDGYKGTVGGDIRMCQSSAMLAEQAQMACAGRTSCSSAKIGDLNGDNLVNLFDYNILLGNFGKSGAAGSIKGDLNRDGVVNIFDYNILLRNFGK